MTRFRGSLLAVWLLVWTGTGTGLAMDCGWNQAGDENQTLVGTFRSVTRLVEAASLESCKSACCDRTDCDMVWVGFPEDGPPQCTLLSVCPDRDRDQDQDLCDVQTSDQQKAFRKTTGNEETRGGEEEEEEEEDQEQQEEEEEDQEQQEEDQDQEQGQADQELRDGARCEAQADVGPCRASVPRWYYNSATQKCLEFIYGGCRGNKNNFESQESCQAACTVNVLDASKQAGADEVSAEYRDKCMEASDPGPCRAAFPMFYYDPNSKTCLSFIYGGCRGNNNRYASMEECESSCSAEGRVGSHGESRNRWSTALFFFVTLAAISGLLLATLLIISLRRRNVVRRLSSVSDKEELLPEPDEQS